MKKTTTLRALGALLALTATAAYADQITVMNNTDNTIWAAFYRSSKLRGDRRISEPVLIEAQSNVQMDRPRLLSGYGRRYLVISDDQASLQDQLGEFSPAHSAMIGIGRTSDGRSQTELTVIQMNNQYYLM